MRLLVVELPAAVVGGLFGAQGTVEAQSVTLTKVPVVVLLHMEHAIFIDFDLNSEVADDVVLGVTGSEGGCGREPHDAGDCCGGCCETESEHNFTLESDSLRTHPPRGVSWRGCGGGVRVG